MTAPVARPNPPANWISPGVATATSSPESDMARFTGFDGHEAPTVTRPLRAVDAEMLVRSRRAEPSSARHGGVRHLARSAWEHRSQFVIFAVNGVNVFAIGLLIQVILVKYAGMGHIPSYIVQTIASVQFNFLLSRYVTWRDRSVAFLGALGRFNLQQFMITGVGMAAYAGLERLGMNYITANVAVTAVLAPVSFLSSHLWSLTEPVTTAGPQGKAARHWHYRVSSRFPLVAMVLVTAAMLWAVVTWPPIRCLVYAAWMMPLGELALLVIGQLWFRFHYREGPPGAFTRLIIQVTTTGHEHERVTEIIRQIRDYQLTMNYQIWVVTEPGSRTDYQLADLVIIVPRDFSARSAKKARALEYSRRVRVRKGLDRSDVKILFNDDDVSLTKGYIERAFAADYDICEGIVTPRTCYAIRPFWHFALSHADDIRTHACLVYCAVFQGILNRPVHVHGEGLTVTGAAERAITWDIPLIASEDLAFGQQAARARNLRWGWFHEYAEVTSPWSLRDFMIQRSRWLWGDIHAIGHRDVMPLAAALRVSAKYVAGVLGLAYSAAGLYLRATGRIPATSPILTYAKLSIVSWVGVIFACGWIGASSATSARNDDSRLLAGVMAVLMMPVSVALTFAAVVVPLAEGDPRTFRVIRKTRSSA